ncbi:MAG: hypothetical protein WC971_03800 [Coriobacteriia bacterium]
MSDFRRLARELAIDAGWALLWAALLVAVLVFAGGGSPFIYIDF